jgi:hypothetical protein
MRALNLGHVGLWRVETPAERKALKDRVQGNDCFSTRIHDTQRRELARQVSAILGFSAIGGATLPGVNQGKSVLRRAEELHRKRNREVFPLDRHPDRSKRFFVKKKLHRLLSVRTVRAKAKIEFERSFPDYFRHG